MPEFSLSDARRTLDLRRELPAFERLSRSEAAELGTTKENYGYGPEASELEVYVRARRLHIIVAVIEAIDDPLQRTLHDSVINDEEDLRRELFSSFLGLLPQTEFGSVILPERTTEITFPDVGELANFGVVEGEVDGDVRGADHHFNLEGEIEGSWLKFGKGVLSW